MTRRFQGAEQQFPRAYGYDVQWILDNAMGPHVLWLTEWLCQAMNLLPGMRVLDLGCGKAISSIFLAKEFGVTVWAADLWIAAEENRQRIAAAGQEGRVLPVHAEAHALPFDHGFFDAILSQDAYHYFGTEETYLDYAMKFLAPAGPIGVVVPGVREEFDGGVPEYLKPYWEPGFETFHSPPWWRRLWEKSVAAEIEVADFMPDGAPLWRQWSELMAERGPAGLRKAMAREARMLSADAGRNLGFTRIVGQRRVVG